MIMEPLALIFGFVAGALVSTIAIALFLSIAHEIPVSTIHSYISKTIYKNKCKHNKSFTRLSEKQIKNAFDISKYPKDKYPYMDIQPQTVPSPELQFIDACLSAARDKTRESDLKLSVKELLKIKREDMKKSIITTKPPLNCAVQHEILNIPINNNNINDNNATIQIPVYWLSYPGSSLIKHGIIIYCHGGAYIGGSPHLGFAMLSLLSKLTGMIICAIDYHKAPEFLLPSCVNDLINVYQHFFGNLNSKSCSKYFPKIDNFNHKKCIFMGESSGGGLVLLGLQALKKYKLPMPAACWAVAPWTNIAADFASYDRNDGNDAMLNGSFVKILGDIVVGNIDIGDDKKSKDEEYDLHDPTVSPYFGNWENICPILFQVGATELLLDDILNAADKAYKSGVKVKVDIHPFGMHSYPSFVNQMPEATDACVRGCQFIKQYTTNVLMQG